ncbi:hypothetical protein Pmani_004932 [Petrolisthes manimaculis]|uniref:Protein AATF n=1 Tax=Petrolisthes manimaculis TaxID=1843537 RepID=A0AAE1QCR7_9EUCA|nr:hypothetical protein Pmani_004932 [Petrolisthes manimaculis]
MAAELKSYVEKYLLNPGASFAVDEEGNQNAKPEVVEALADGERADEAATGVSKLRARSAALLQEKDPRYRGKKVSRHDLNKDKQVEFDPELTKYFLVEGDGGEEEGEESDEHVDSEDDEEEIDDEEGENVNSVIKMDDDEEDIDDENVGYENSDDEDDDDDNVKEEAATGSGVRFVDDGNFSKFADDFDNEKDDDSEQEEDDDFEDKESESETDDDDDDDDSAENQTIKRFHSDDHHDQRKKGQAVRHQLAIYDSLFEGRIGLQKVMSASNQIPQYDTYKLFLGQKDPNYTRNIIAAKSATRLLLTTLIQLQELLLKQNPETSHIITGKKSKFGGTESDEEITSSEDEDQDQDMEQGSSGEARGVKRKMKLEECEEALSKRHTAITPFRDFTINKWYEKTKLLSSHSGGGGNKFGGFETSALQQLHNVLANKPQLLRRTQLTGATRGTAYQVLGRLPQQQQQQHQEQQQKQQQQPQQRQQPKADEYDPEIFDDTDFYSRCLEEVLKSKVALSDDMTDVSRKWIEIQNLRRKTKRTVDKKASKGRKLRYEVMSKLQQYLAPSYFSPMDDAAINTLFASLFGKSTQQTPTTA